MFQKWCTCPTCRAESGHSAGKKWTHQVHWHGHRAALDRERLQQECIASHPSPPSLTVDERSHNLFLATAVETSRDPRHVVLTSRTATQSEPSPIPSEGVTFSEVVEGVSALQRSLPHRASETDKREAHHASVMARSQLKRIEERLRELSTSLKSPTAESLSVAERDFRGILGVFTSIRRVTPSLEQRKSTVRESLNRVQARMFELRNLYPTEASLGPVYHDTSHHYDMPVNEYHVVAQVAMFLGIVLHVLGKASRTMSDFLLSGLSLLVGLAFQTSHPPSQAAGLSLEQDSILAQIPCNLKTALERFNLSARTETYAACSRCHCTYDPVPDVHYGNMTYQEQCTNIPLPGGPQCGEFLLKAPANETLAAIPKRPYVVHDFDDYVSGLLSDESNVRDLNAACDAAMDAIKRNEPVDEISHPYQGEFVRTFWFDQERKLLFIDRRKEIRILFALHVDSFNTNGLRTRGATSSATVISMSALGLPVERRYKSENIYLASIIAGPYEPPLEALNHYLRPIVNALTISWKRGVLHSRVATMPKGCVSRSAIAAAVMDLVAARKTAQLASHSAHIYCGICTCCRLDTRGRVDYENWVRRDPAEMRRQAENWRDASTQSERKKIFELHGVRWSELWRLPYWDPTRQLVVDSMHCIFEGLIPYHFRGILGLTVADAAVKDEIAPAFTYDFREVDAEANRELGDSDENKLQAKAISDVRLIHRDLCSPVQEDDVESELKQLHKNLSKRTLGALRFVGCDLDIMQVKDKMTRKDWADGLVAWRRLQPFSPAEPAHEKLATPEVIGRIQEVIRDADTPSWLSSVPKNFGDARAGTLKADEWRILCTVYFPVALISLWGAGAPYAQSRDAAFLLQVLDNTMMLVSAVIVLCKRTTSRHLAQKYREYLAQWVRGVQNLHPKRYSDRTNIHVAFHIYDFLLLFAAIYSWWCFPFERLIGHLQRLPHNDKSGEVEVTMLNSYLRAARLRRWFQRSDCPPALRQVKRFFDKAFGNGDHARSTVTSEPSIDESTPIRSTTSIPEDLRMCLPHVDHRKVALLARYEHDGYMYARASTHVGNSLVRYYLSDRTAGYGSIKYIFQVGDEVKLAVQRHLPAKGPDPFRRYEDFRATVRSPELSPDLECISFQHVICQFARWQMPSGDVAVVSLYKD